MSETPVKDRPAESAPEQAPPPQLGPYRLVKRLGGGGMGHIYLAEQPSVGRQVAIKVLPPDAFDDANAVARFQREIQILGKLSHPNICPVLEAGVDGSTHYYVMELIRGIDLAKVVRTQRMDPRRAAEIAVQIGRALRFAHDNGVIHRDLKPLNVMLSRGERRKEPLHARPASSSFVSRLFSRKPASRKLDDSGDAAPADPALPSPGYLDRVTLIDFGLARQGRKTSLTASGEMVGTPAYMSPEQARGDVKTVGPTADIYSLGATLYEMLTLQPPFSGESLPDILMQVITADPRTPSRLNPHVDRDLETIVLKAMEKEPRRRYLSARDLVADLEHWLAGEPIAARRASLVYRLRKRVARHKLASAALLIVIATLTALGASLLSWYTAPGLLSVETVPAGAEVLVDGRRLGLTPVQGAPVPPGRVRLELRLADHVAIVDSPLIERRKGTHVARQFRHEEGSLTFSSEPPGVAIALPRRQISAPATALPLDTGTYRGTASARNFFSREIEFHVARDAETRRHVTLNAMTLWRHDGGTIVSPASSAADVNADGRPDIVAVWVDPPHVAALDGATGHALWQIAETVAGVCIADLDGDLEADVVCASAARVAVHEGRTGRLLRDFDVADVGEMRALPDINGNAWCDLVVAFKGGGIAALDGRDGRRIWQLDAVNQNRLVLARLTPDTIPDVVAGGWHMAPVAVDGRTGRALWMARQERTTGTPVAGDLNGDRIDDVVVSDDGGRLLAFDGRDGRPLWSVTHSAGTRGLAAVGDVDGDGLPEVVKGGPDVHTIAIVSRSGELLRELPLPTSWGPAVLCDMNGDGRADIVIPTQNNTLVAVDATTGARVWTFVCERSPELPLLGDFNADGRQDLAVMWGGTMAVVSAQELPVLWKRPASAWDLESVQPVGEPVTDLFISAAPAMRIDPRDGSVRAEHPFIGAVSAVDARARVAVATGDPVTLLELDSMKPRWRVPMSTNWTHTPLIVDGNEDGVPDVCLIVEPDAFTMLDGRSGERLWSTHQAPAQGHSLMAHAGGVLYACTGDGARGLSLRDGRVVWSFVAGTWCTAVAVSGDTLFCATATGEVSAFRRPAAVPDAAIDARRDILWRRATGSAHGVRSLAVRDSMVACVTRSGEVRSLDRDTGAVRWTTRLFHESHTGLALHDVDRDGWPDVAVQTRAGRTLVLSGADGRTLWTYDLRCDATVGGPAWVDLDGDAAPELVFISRDGYAYALRVQLSTAPTVLWPRDIVRDAAEASRETERQRVLAALAEARAQDRAGDILELARDGAPAAVFYHAARIAHARQDARGTRELAERARDAGCRRVDLELMLDAHEAARIFCDATPAHIADLDWDPSLADAWRTMAADVERIGPAERAALALAPVAPAGKLASLLERAVAADPGLLHAARARAAEAAGRLDEARREFIAARRHLSVATAAERALARLDALAETWLAGALAAANGGRHAEGEELALRVTQLRPEQPNAWYVAAWCLVRLRRDAPRAVELAARSVALQRRAGGVMLSRYLDTLAAAHFAAGNVPEAVEAQRESCLLPPHGEEKKYRERLRLYEAALKQ